jgi:hypothetical protein
MKFLVHDTRYKVQHKSMVLCMVHGTISCFKPLMKGSEFILS